MNFLSSALSSITGNSIPYTIKDKLITDANLSDSNSIWTIYNGENPKDSTKVTIFQYNLANSQLSPLATNAFKKAKLIKFPGIINIIDFFEFTDSLYVVTEAVTPALTYLKSHELSQQCKLFGIYNIAQCIQFINSNCNCLVGNLNLQNSIYINSSGEWKLFGFELLTNLTSDPNQPFYRYHSLMPGLSQSYPSLDAESVRQFPTKLDSYLFGLFINTVLSTQDFNNINFTTVPNSAVPKQLIPLIKQLTNSSINLRITVDKFLSSSKSLFDNNDIIKFNNELDEIKFKNHQEKLDFFKYQLGSYIDGDSPDNAFPPGLLENKLLPELSAQYSVISKFKPGINTTPEEIMQNQETLSVILNHVLNLSGSISPDKFNTMVKPIIFESFTANDRSIRISLLNHLPEFEQFLTDSEIQSKIFYNLLSGFQDTNFTIRETTLKSITTIIDKVSVKQVNQDLLKILAKSQMDPKPSIRVNTLVLIIKISSKIYKTSKNNVLITALSKSLRDSFIPCKMTALLGFESLRDEFSLEEICSKVLGHLAISLMDPKSAKVRQEAKRIFQLYLDSVEKHASTLPTEEVDENEDEAEFYRKYASQNEIAGSTNGSNAKAKDDSSFGFGWGMVNKLVATSVKGELNHDFNTSTPDLTRVTTPTGEQLKTLSMDGNNGSSNDNTTNGTAKSGWDDFGDDDEDGGWGNVDDEVEIVPAVKNMVLSSNKGSETQGAPRGLHLSNKPAATKRLDLSSRPGPTRKPTSGLKLGKPKKPAAKLNLKVDDDEDDGWGGDW